MSSDAIVQIDCEGVHLDVQRLCERAAELRMRHKVLETVPGSGFHDNDRDAHNRLAAPHRRHLVGGMSEGSKPLPRLSDHLICFDGDRELIFAGQDAVKAQTCLTQYLQELRGRNLLDLSGSERRMLIEIPKMLFIESVKPPLLRLWHDTWNDYLFAFEAQGVGISCLPLEE